MKKVSNKLNMIILLLTIIIILTAVTIIFKFSNEAKKDKKSNTDNTIVICDKQMPGKLEYDIFNIAEIQKEGNIVIGANVKRKLIYKDEGNYEGFKENEVVINPQYDDTNLSVIYEVGTPFDLTKDENGNKIETKWEDISDLLKQYGYSCNNG